MAKLGAEVPDDASPGEDTALRVALLTPCYWPEVHRGTERLLRELADGLLARGHRPSVITSHPGFPSRAVEDGLPVLRLPRPSQRRLLRRRCQPYLTHVPLSYLALYAGGHQVAHAFYPTDALAACRWRRETGRPAVLTYNGIPDRRGLCEYRFGIEIMAAAVRGCDAVVAVSRYAAEACERWLGRRAHVIHPGVNVQAFNPVPARSNQPTIVCTAAVEVPRKNVALLIEAFALVRKRYADARLVLVRPQDEGAARRAGVTLDFPGVEWIDHGQERSVLARTYGEAWVAVLPSVDEAFGLVLTEALACGTPVVGHAHGGIPEIVDRGEIGRLFHRLEPRALAQAILETVELAEDPNTASHCRARAEEFSTQRSTDRYLALYRQLLGAAAPAAPAERQPSVRGAAHG